MDHQTAFSIALESDDSISNLNMAAMVHAFDWSRTPLGPMKDWPRSLQTVVGICLKSQLPMFVWWGPELINIHNDAYAPILGNRHPHALGQPARQIWADIWPSIGEEVEAVITRGVPVVKERVRFLLQRHGYAEETYFTYSSSPIPDDDGGIGGLLQVCSDETARVLAERERDHLAEQRQLALDAAQMGWWHYDPQTGDASFDKRYTEIFGVTGHQRPNDEILKRLHPDDLPGVWAKVEAALDPTDPRAYTAQFRIMLDDGSTRWIEAHGSATFAGAGTESRATSFVGTVADISNRMLAEERERNAIKDVLAAAEANAKFRTFFDQGTYFAVIMTVDGTVVEANRLCMEACGFTREQIIGKKFWDCGWWSPSPTLMDMIRTGSAMAASGQTFRKESAYFIADGTKRFVDLTLSPVTDDLGRVLFIAPTGIDITEQKRMTDDRERLLNAERAARTEAERASQMKDEFLATLSHELRTPLNAILGWAAILSDGNANQTDLHEGMKVIERNARAQTQIIEDLLDMSRIISGKVRLEVQRTDVAPLLQAAVDTMRPAADAKGVRLRAVLDQRAGLVSGDPGRLQQIFWNLLNNAVKFTPRGGQIHIVLQRVNSHLEITIADTGEGIAPEFLPHVFDRFRQADASTTRRHGGLGLGLAIVKQLVELHGGTIQVKSPGIGAGSTFTIVLPVMVLHADPDEETAQRRHPVARAISPAELPECPRLAGVRVLVVDDEPDARSLVKRLLEDCEAQVRVAASADEALQLIAAERPDVLISDIGMPVADGYALIRQVRALPLPQGGDIPAVALTAYARTEDRVRALRAGFKTHIAKPVEPVELITVIASLTGRTGE